MRQFVAELRRRNVFRAGALYIASTWALAQGIAQLGPVVGAPDGLTRWFLIGTAIGFPFWIASAWLYEFTHEGLKRGSEIDASESIARQTGRKLDRWIIAVLAGAVVLLLTDHFAVRRDAEKVPARTASPTAASVDIPDIDKDPSVAVLPLVDMSQGKDQEYFSDGISEELLNLLTKVPQLRVIARTSSFSFKGKDSTSLISRASSMSPPFSKAAFANRAIRCVSPCS